MHFSAVLILTLVVMITLTPVPSDQAHMNRRSVGAVRMEEPTPIGITPGVDGVGDDRMDISRQGGGGYSSHLPQMPQIPHMMPQMPHIPMPGFGSLFGTRQLPFDAISGPYVSSSLGPVFNSYGPLGGIGVPFSPGPLGGMMGIPLAMLAMG